MGSERRDRPVYVISVAAELAGMHPQTLRAYERKGLIEPERTPGGSRRYTEADIERLRRIQQLTDEGLTLRGAQRLLALEAQLARARAEIERLRAAVAQLSPRALPSVEPVRASDAASRASGP